MLELSFFCACVIAPPFCLNCRLELTICRKKGERDGRKILKEIEKIATMDSLNPRDTLEFIGLVNNLKHSSRRGWAICNVDNHEQIAGHMYSMGMMTFLLGDNSTLDRFKCLQLALVHDLAECIVGDITPHDNIPEDEKHAMEDEAMQKITKNLNGGIGANIYTLYKEYEAKETPEALFVKDLDRFDMLFTASYYEKRDGTPKKMEEFFTSTEGKFKNPFVQKLVAALKEDRDQPDSANLKQ